uniref:Uncharacterized protein n=1 Tax=Cannabis sativa TaxID=3483 RepID=A0A803QC37_CANSA
MEDQGEVRPSTTAEAKCKEEEGVVRVYPFGGFNEKGEPVSETGEVLEAGWDYVEEEYTEAHPINRRGPKGARWVSPPFVLNTNLF